MGLFDRARVPVVVPVAPRRTVEAKRSFAAAAFSRLFGAWTTTLVSPDDDLEMGLQAIRARSRDLTDNNPLAAAAARAFVENIAGPNGMLCSPQVTTRTGDLRSNLNRKLSLWFAEWGQPGTCTMDGRLSWVDLQRLFVRTWRVDGEFFAIEHRGRGVNRFGYALQPIDADQVDHNYKRKRTATQNEIRMGVELDAYERPVAYHVFKEHPSSGNRERERIPADRMIHCFEQLRPGQTRGIPAGIAAMARLKMGDQYDQFELGAAQLAAGMAVLFKQAAEGPALVGADGKDLEAEIPLSIEAMQGKLLPPGVEPFALSAEHPTSAYESFSRAWRRAVGTAYGLAYSTITGELRLAPRRLAQGTRPVPRLPPLDGDALLHARLPGRDGTVGAHGRSSTPERERGRVVCRRVLGSRVGLDRPVEGHQGDGSGDQARPDESPGGGAGDGPELRGRAPRDERRPRQREGVGRARGRRRGREARRAGGS